ncbi:ABC transporter permease [Natrinema salifodinae]|uniref:Putative ABC transport system permease protein n=1 Tax=Natrinema salifodinae TaxID=1202768 RepID=A0A1I0QI07_9EURY|nr:ABC transporter permease [Natrinema salifodinae]SEW26620.1 putative ABC transport system permease protein [Natrinema salifodinae]
MDALGGFFEQFTDPVLLTGLAQVAVAAVLAALVVGLSHVRGLALERELGVALVRGLVQIVAMGSIVGLLLTVDFAWSAVILLGMMGGATWISKNRGAGLPGVVRVSFVAILFGAGLVIVTMTLAGAIEATVRNLVPVGSMIIANAMQINSLALDRFKSEIQSNRPEIEADLALGAPPQAVVSRHVKTGVRASLIPTIDSLKSLGWVWIPGIMAGMILGGENPIYAALYQFVIMAMIFAAGGLTSVTSSLLIGTYVFTDAEQLKPIDAAADES